MKLWMILAVTFTFLVAAAAAVSQRKIGNTRSDQTTTTGASQNSRGERSSPPSNPSPGPVSHSPIPSPIRPPVDPGPPAVHPVDGTLIDIVGDCPVPPSPVILATGSTITANKPVNKDAELIDCQRVPRYGGFDFSEGEVVPYDDDASDMYLTVDGGVCSMRVCDDTDIQDLGETKEVAYSRSTPSDGWSVNRAVPLKVGNAYAVWAWDGEYSQFEVTDMTQESVVFTWASIGSISRKVEGPMFGR